MCNEAYRLLAFYKRLSDTTKDYADLMLNSAVSIEIHDSQSDKLIAKYGDKSSIDKVNAILDIENWEKVENIDKNINPIYTLELYYDTTKQDANDDIKEIRPILIRVELCFVQLHLAQLRADKMIEDRHVNLNCLFS